MIYLMGGGGHAKVVAEILEVNGQSIAGVFEIDFTKKLWQYPIYAYPGPFVVDTDYLLLTIGSNTIRKRVAETIVARYITAIHPSAQISKRAVLGHGTVVMANAVINSEAQIGVHAIINTSASIDHECRIGDYCHISPNATLSGAVSVGDGSHIGAGTTLLPGVSIGKNAIVGAGSVVIKNVPDNVVVAGCPAKFIKENV